MFDRRTKGYEFTCDFAKVAERCYWDAEVQLDLSDAVSIIGWVHKTNSPSAHAVNIHFRSGGDWYSWIFYPVDGWNNIAAHIEQFYAPGGKRVEGWQHQIDRIRVSLWKETGNNSTVVLTFYDVETSWKKVEQRPFEYPEYDITPSPVRREKRDPNTGTLLESRVILDEGSLYLCCYKNIVDTRSLLDIISSAGFNVYMPNVWHGSGARYRSPVGTPFDVTISPFQEGFDPLADLIKEAHVRGIEVHPWFSVALLQHPDPANFYPQYAEPGTPPGAFDLQNPGFRDFIVREIVEFAKKYDIDGINLDVIRTHGVSFSKTAADLYFQRYGVSIDELKESPRRPEVERRFLEWQRDAVSDVVRRVSQGIKAAKPRVVISVDGYPDKKPLLNQEGRNEWIWVENGWVDLVYMMGYAQVPDIARLQAVRRNSPFPNRFIMLPGNFDRTKEGEVIPRDADLLVRQIDYFLRKFPGAGIGLYLLSMLSEEQITALKNGLFKERAIPFWKEVKEIGVLPPSPPRSLMLRD